MIFIHFNQTKPVIDVESQEGEEVMTQGCRIAKIWDVFLIEVLLLKAIIITILLQQTCELLHRLI